MGLCLGFWFLFHTEKIAEERYYFLGLSEMARICRRYQNLYQILFLHCPFYFCNLLGFKDKAT